MIKPEIDETTMDTAIFWFVRQKADNISEVEENEFFDWLLENKDHQSALGEIAGLWNKLDVIKEETFEGLHALEHTRQGCRNSEINALS